MRTSTALLFLDLDHFKRVNDLWGHRAGDELLHAIAQRVRAALRPQDFVGRYGGEEFLILLPGVDVQAAMQIADYVRSLSSKRLTGPCIRRNTRGATVCTLRT